MFSGTLVPLPTDSLTLHREVLELERCVRIKLGIILVDEIMALIFQANQCTKMSDGGDQGVEVLVGALAKVDKAVKATNVAFNLLASSLLPSATAERTSAIA